LFAFECQRAGLKDIELEPLLLPTLGMELESKRAKRMDGARSDVRVRGFWGNQQNAFFEFRVFYSCAKSYSTLKPAECYNRFEPEHKSASKKRKGDRKRLIRLLGSVPWTCEDPYLQNLTTP